MYSFLKGTIITKQFSTPFGTSLIFEVNGIGFRLMVSTKTLNKLPIEGSQSIIYTQLIHREDTMILCGFISSQERDLFNILLSVSGIGTKVALKLIGDLEPIELISAVIKQDYKKIAATKGIGPKIAQRIVLELKDKMINWRSELEKASEIKSDMQPLDSYIEAESVLLSLGYSTEEIKEALKVSAEKTKNQSDTEEVLQNALKWLSM